MIAFKKVSISYSSEFQSQKTCKKDIESSSPHKSLDSRPLNVYIFNQQNQTHKPKKSRNPKSINLNPTNATSTKPNLENFKSPKPINPNFQSLNPPIQNSLTLNSQILNVTTLKLPQPH